MGRAYRRTWIALVVVAGIMTAIPAHANNIFVTVRAAGQIAPQFLADGASGDAICNQASPGAKCIYGVESFSGLTSAQAQKGFTSTFSTGQNDFTASQYLTGSYSGQLTRIATDQYGGVKGSAAYPAALGVQTYSLAIAGHGVPGANYFGLWISAMDATNVLRLHTSDNQTFDFTTNSLQKYIATTATPNAYYGNPTSYFLGQNSGEPYAYVNFFDMDGYVTGVDFSNNAPTGFESSNHALGYFDPLVIPGHQALQQSVPMAEPASALLVGAGLTGLAFQRRRRKGRPEATPTNPA